VTGEVPESLRLSVGSSQEIVLPGLGTAGYLWSAEVVGDDNIVDVTWRRGFAKSEHPLVGASAPERITLTASSPGEVVVRLTQSRRWETGKPPRAEHVVHVVVEEVP
jgi:Chagasin family peptidase inhibitor I42